MRYIIGIFLAMMVAIVYIRIVRSPGRPWQCSLHSALAAPLPRLCHVHCPHQSAVSFHLSGATSPFSLLQAMK